MKLARYFVPMNCPWCGQQIMLVNSSSKRPVVSAELCQACKDKLDSFPGPVALIVSGVWLTNSVQDLDVPVYPFVKGIIVNSKNPPPGPYYKERFAILPLEFLQRMGFPTHAIEAMQKAKSPIIFDESEGVLKPKSSHCTIMRPGTC